MAKATKATQVQPVNNDGEILSGGDGKIQDGEDTEIEATVLDYTNSNPLAVRLSDSNGDYVGAGAGTQYADGDAVATPTGTTALGHDGSNVQALLTDVNGRLQVDVLTGGGSGDQYTEADTDASITGTAIMWEDASDTLRAVSVSKPLPVDLGSNNDITVTSGAITETNSGDIKTAIELLDNAVDGSALNTNMNIAGTDVSAGAGVLTAQTQRVAIATDDEVNNLLGTIDTDTGVIAGDTTSLDGKVTACNTGAVVVSSGAITETNSGDIKTAIEIIDNAITGNEMQVDVVAELPAGTQLIGKTGIDQTTPGTTNNVSVTTVKPDGTNTMPSLDAVGRAGFVKITDGTETALVSDDGLLQVSTPAEALILTGASIAEDAQMDGMYTLTGAGPHYFYLPVNTTNAVEIIDMLFKTSSAVTLELEFQALSQGASNWKAIPAYTTGEYAADGTSEDLNAAFPLRHIIGKGNEYRAKATVGGSTTVGVQIMGIPL